MSYIIGLEVLIFFNVLIQVNHTRTTYISLRVVHRCRLDNVHWLLKSEPTPNTAQTLEIIKFQQYYLLSLNIKRN